MNIEDLFLKSADSGLWSAVIRLALAIVCGGLIGIDRGRRRRPAGFRTHMLVCMGAALTMIIEQYIVELVRGAGFSVPADISRFGAQVVSGIGFLGAGTIIVTGRQEIKGLTTAAGLWASACMGLAIGAGFYYGALLACLLIFFSITVMRRFESFVLSHSRNMNIYVEFTDINDIGFVIDTIKERGIKIYDVEINKAPTGIGAYANAIFYMRLPDKKAHSDIISALLGVKSVRSIEEI